MCIQSWLGRVPGVGNGNLLWYSCLKNSVDRGAWGATVHGVTESEKTEGKRTHIHIFFFMSFSIIGYYKILNKVSDAIW